MEAARGRRRWAVAAAVALLALAVVLPFLGDDRDPSSTDRPGAGSSSGITDPAQQAVQMAVELTPRARTGAPDPGCGPARTTPFRPVAAEIPGVTDGAEVIAMHRDANGVPGVPPLSSSGKHAFAWDDDPRSSRPGTRRGNVLLNAHTWPDGTALGNHLLQGLQEGELVVLEGPRRQRLCYRVTERVEVPGDRPYLRYYRDTGAPQLALLVCSGQRLGPGHWTHRTIWFAEPVSG